jgi:nuclear pore complex protein Nup62
MSEELACNASKVAASDRRALDTETKLCELRKEVLRVDVQQVELEASLDVVEQYQRQLDQLLTTLETEFQRTAEGGDPDKEREAAFLLAQKLDTQLESVSQSLKDLTSTVNQSVETKTDDVNPAVLQLEEVLNRNLHALTWVDGASRDIDRKLKAITTSFKTNRSRHK